MAATVLLQRRRPGVASWQPGRCQRVAFGSRLPLAVIVLPTRAPILRAGLCICRHVLGCNAVSFRYLIVDEYWTHLGWFESPDSDWSVARSSSCPTAGASRSRASFPALRSTRTTWQRVPPNQPDRNERGATLGWSAATQLSATGADPDRLARGSGGRQNPTSTGHRSAGRSSSIRPHCSRWRHGRPSGRSAPTNRCYDRCSGCSTGRRRGRFPRATSVGGRSGSPGVLRVSPKTSSRFTVGWRRRRHSVAQRTTLPATTGPAMRSSRRSNSLRSAAATRDSSCSTDLQA